MHTLIGIYWEGELIADSSCLSDQIDKHTLEIAQADDEVYSNMQELADELPGHSPRYVLLSYPLTLVRRPIAPN